MNRWKYVLVGLLVGAFAFPLVWVSDPLVIGQTVTVDSTQSPLVVNALADLADLTPTDGQSVIIKTGTEKGLWYYDKDSVAVVDSVAVLTGPGSVGRFLVINNDAGSIAAATAITAAQIDNDVDLEFGVFDADSPRSLTLAELKKTGIQVVNVKQYGALGDGSNDDTAEIQAAIDALPDTGGTLYFPAGTYKVSDTASYASLNFVSLSNVRIIADGATIKAANAMSAGNGTNLLYFQACSRFEISGLIVDGNRANRTPSGEMTTYNLVFEDCDWFTLNQVKSVNSCIDGFVLNATDEDDPATYCTNFKIENCEADNCWRQGMSIINAISVTVVGGKYVNTTGTAPQAGIDIESNIAITTGTEDINQNILIKNVVLSGNVGAGVMVSASSATGVTIEGCEITANNGAAIIGGQVTFRGNYVHGISTCSGNGLVECVSSTYARGIIIDGNRFANCSAAKPCVSFHSSITDPVVSNNTAYECDHFVASNAVGTAITGNNVSESNNTAVGFCQCYGSATITGNNVNGWLGRLGYISASCVITGNNFYDGDDITFAAFQFAAGTSVVANNRFVNAGAETGYVIRADSGSTVYSSGNVISNFSSDWNYVNSGVSVIDHIGAGGPDTVISASIGSVWRRTDGGAAATLYVKESGTGNTGWATVNTTDVP